MIDEPDELEFVVIEVAGNLTDAAAKYLKVESSKHGRELVYPLLEESYRQWIHIVESLLKKLKYRDAIAAIEGVAYNYKWNYGYIDAQWVPKKERRHFWLDMTLDQWLAYYRKTNN